MIQAILMTEYGKLLKKLKSCYKLISKTTKAYFNVGGGTFRYVLFDTGGYKMFG